jgi:multidrug resistance efflux pump
MIRKYVFPILAIAGILLAIWSVISGAKAAQGPAPLGAASSSDQSGRAQITGTGIVEANTENIAIGTLESGVVVDVPVQVNQDIHKGDVLFRLDSRDLEAQRKVQEAAVALAEKKLAKLLASPRPEDVPPLEAKVSEAEAALADAQSQWQRANEIKDTRAISADELIHRKYTLASAEAALAEAKATLAQLKAGTWAPDIEIARAEVLSAKAVAAATQTNIDRLSVRSPIDGKVLQRNVRVGEYAQAGSPGGGGPPTAPMLVGNINPLYVRVDVDENDAYRVRGQPQAQGAVRGSESAARRPLKFVRIEPYVIPKRSLTGDATERVDTRVLQLIYSLEASGLDVYVGQQMDVFIQTSGAP